MKYRIRYNRLNKDKAIPCTEDVTGISATSALNSFHRELQLTRKLAEDKSVVRDCLAPSEYQITSVSLLYNADPWGRLSGETIESSIDLPSNPRNPDLRLPAKKPAESEMAFMEALDPGRLAE